MNCPNCNKGNITTFFNEDIPCIHCNEINKISYNVCPDCGFVWKDNEGQPVSGMVFEGNDFQEILESATYILPEGLEEEGRATMDEVIHKCLRCSTISYEVQQGLYHCPECGFEWEVI